MINWHEYGLRKNPFGLVPDKDSPDLIWAGFKENKTKFDSIITNALQSEESSVVLNISRYGGGKTHTSFYYSNPLNIPEFSGIEKPLSVSVLTPKRGENAPWELYTKIIEELGVGQIVSMVAVMRDSLGDNQGLLTLSEWTRSEDLGRILWLLADKNDDVSFGAEQLLLGENPTSKLKNSLRIRRGLQGLSDVAQVLSAVVKLFSEFDSNGKRTRPRKIFIWLDELESLVYYTSKQYRPFTQALRELIDRTPKNLCLIMNFSFAEPSDVSNLEILIGEALLDRVTAQFVFEEAAEDDAIEYVKELLGHFRTNGFNGDALYPFTIDSLKEMLVKAPDQTEQPILPRTINKWCKKVLEDLEQQVVSPENPINKEAIRNVSFLDEGME